jgi:hypothetical protein
VSLQGLPIPEETLKKSKLKIFLTILNNFHFC